MKSRNQITKRALFGTLISLSVGVVHTAHATDHAGTQRVQCPDNLIRDAKVRTATQLESMLAERHGDSVVISRHRIDGNAECLLQTAPFLSALAADEPLTFAAEPPRSSVAMTTDLVHRDRGATCGFGTPLASVFAGRCGVSGKQVASAWFVSDHLALAGGDFFSRNDEFCVVADGRFHDVHQVRRISAGREMVTGLSLMKSVPRSVGVRAVTGPLNSAGGVGIALSVEGTRGTETGCHGGYGSSDDGTFASFHWTSYTFERPQMFSFGGPAFVSTQNPVPMGTHVDYRTETTSGVNHVYPVLRRFKPADIDTISVWANSAAPAQPVTITSPGYGAVVNSNIPLHVSVSATGATMLELDGVPVGNPITNLEPGTHRLVAHRTGAPNFRHTILINAQPLVSADAHETDDTPEQWKALWDRQPKHHTFHRANDVDWSAFAIGAGTRVNVAMNGSAFGQCSMNLFLHPNYPNGVRQLVHSATGSCASLSVQTTSPLSPSAHVYFLETKLNGSATGNMADYHLLATTSPDPIAADAYEVDDTRDQYKALFYGQPQQHNYHRAGDVDWTAFAVGPGSPVRVTVSGPAAERSRIRLFRQVDYPTGAIVEVMSREASSPLVVTDQISHAGPYTVYYVETSPIWSGFHGTASTYQISVE